MRERVSGTCRPSISDMLSGRKNRTIQSRLAVSSRRISDIAVLCKKLDPIAERKDRCQLCMTAQVGGLDKALKEISTVATCRESIQIDLVAMK